MSRYTTELRFICEERAGLDESIGLVGLREMLEIARPKVFFFQYPIFDETYKPLLETKILRHYYTREIAFETFSLWVFHLENKMMEIMPYYNQLYKSTLLEFNPFYDVDLTRDYKLKRDEDGTNHSATTAEDSLFSNEQINREDKGKSTLENNSSNASAQDVNGEKSAKERFSDTPQGGLFGIEQDQYLTTAKLTNEETSQATTSSSSSLDTSEGSTEQNTEQKTTSNNNRNTEAETNANHTVNTLDDYLEHVKGKRGMHSYSELLEHYRKTFLNIDMMIIKDLAPLFFNLW